ncbi:D-3-phosphoglycerate dehydrogenase [Syntrophus gentianae]|uniref:D-3-phosphoglycerate dehydrogenase n=1 Tax=Syntrophus gentianae TaxID=43775 RepID=A0A1H7X7M8_9BACT|nr:phosphoglycerate dehydrogenase [Syntrophus gentianae]SEM29701.1 D-3-phosphoglycerate dehydrogenase [Syntrophus gentianae]
MSLKVLISAPYMQPVIDRFRPIFVENGIEIIVPPVQERLEESDLLQWMSDIDGVICGDDRFTERVLRSSPRLKVISKWGTGIDSIDRKTCQQLGIALCNTPNAFSEPLADSVMGYVLCFARNLLGMDRLMKEGLWQKLPGRSLKECTLGVIGVGNVGKAVIRRAKAFGMPLLGNDIVKMPEDFLARAGIRMVPLEALLKKSDFISINCDLNPTSRHLIAAEEFSLMKNSAILINTARGPIVDEQALIKALDGKTIAGAALDVFETEPLPMDSPLRQMRNVLLASHNANSSPEAWERVHLNTIHNLLEVLKGCRS